MRARFLACLIGSSVVAMAAASAKAQIVRCEDGAFRQARDCPGVRQSGAVTNSGTRTAPGPAAVSPAVPAPYQGENVPQYMARLKVYCVSQPPAQRAECQEQAQAQSQLYSANYQAARNPESLQRLGETPPQFAGRWEVYCVSQPRAQRAECRAQAQAQSQLYSANYQAAFGAESLRQAQEMVQKQHAEGLRQMQEIGQKVRETPPAVAPPRNR